MTGSAKLGISAVLVVGVIAAGAFLVVKLSPTSIAVGPCAYLPVGTIRESQEFTPFGQRRGQLPEAPLLGSGPGITPLPAGRDVPELIDGLPLQFAIASNQGPYLFYLGGPIRPDMTRSAFLAEGGLEYQTLSIAEGEPFAPNFILEVGDRATPIKVGPFDGALVWADPTEADIRPHGLYWFDSTRNYSLVGLRGPEHLVNIGRALVCRPFA